MQDSNIKVRLDASYPNHLEAMLQRAQSALEASGFEQLVIASGAQHTQFLDDMPYPFRVNPHFKAWLPVTDVPDCWLVIEPGARPILYFHQPADYWHCVPVVPEAYWTSCFELKTFAEFSEIGACLPAGPGVAVIGEPCLLPQLWQAKSVNPAALMAHLHYQRAAKTAYEQECLRQANRTAARGHRAALDAFLGGGSEFDIYHSFCRGAGVSESALPYGAIVALNEHAATLHYQATERSQPRQRLSFLIDAGVECHGYASDITRTWSTGDALFDALVKGVDAFQQRLAAQVVPGQDYVALHLEAHREVAALLRELEVLTLDAEASVESGITTAFLPHGLGHLLGLQVHDIGGHQVDAGGRVQAPPKGHPYLRLTRRLEEGFVVTIEPGIYFIDSLLGKLRAGENARHINWSRVEQLKPFGGVRIEDDVVATRNGPVNLTREAFAELD